MYMKNTRNENVEQKSELYKYLDEIMNLTDQILISLRRRSQMSLDMRFCLGWHEML